MALHLYYLFNFSCVSSFSTVLCRMLPVIPTLKRHRTATHVVSLSKPMRAQHDDAIHASAHEFMHRKVCSSVRWHEMMLYFLFYTFTLHAVFRAPEQFLPFDFLA